MPSLRSRKDAPKEPEDGFLCSHILNEMQQQIRRNITETLPGTCVLTLSNFPVKNNKKNKFSNEIFACKYFVFGAQFILFKKARKSTKSGVPSL